MRTLETWTAANAALSLAGAALCVAIQSSAPFLPVSLASFGALVFLGRAEWTPSGSFGAANSVTALRVVLVGLLGLPLSGALSAAGLLLVLGLDVVDGWLARRHSGASAFGARFDMETDALLVMVACAALFEREGFGAWIWSAGALRYVYVLVLARFPSRRGEEPRSAFARAAFIVLAFGLAGGFVLPKPFATFTAAAGTALVGVSFARSFLWAYTGARREERAR